MPSRSLLRRLPGGFSGLYDAICTSYEELTCFELFGKILFVFQVVFHHPQSSCQVARPIGLPEKDPRQDPLLAEIGSAMMGVDHHQISKHWFP